MKNKNRISMDTQKNYNVVEHIGEQGIYADIRQAHANWQEAYMYFEQALGEDQVDYAIYMLEAAERKYQMHLKQAKKLGLSREPFSTAGETTTG